MANKKFKKPNKYNNVKITYDGIKFDSIHEAERYCELKLLVKAKVISNLQLQKNFELIPHIVENGKVVQKAIIYRADFVYTDQFGKTVVEDAKGFKTEGYEIKKKLMRYCHNIIIVEV